MWAVILAAIQAALGSGAGAAAAESAVPAVTGAAATTVPESLAATALDASTASGLATPAAAGGGFSGVRSGLSSGLGPLADAGSGTPRGGGAGVIPSRIGTYSTGATPMVNPMPVADAVAASKPVGTWDTIKDALDRGFTGYQNLEIGPGAETLTPSQRSQAFWGAKLQQLSSAISGGNGPAARLAYGQKAVRNANLNTYLDKADAQATTPEEKMRVAEMRAFHIPIKASTPLRPKAPVMRAISDTQEAAFDPDTGAQVGPAVARFKASSGGPKDERMAEEIQAARDKVLSAAQTDDLTSLARLDPTALPKANRMKPGESKSDFAAWNARLRDLQNPPAPPEAPSGPGFFDSLGSWLHSGAAAAKGYGDTLSGGPNTPIDYDAKRRRARAAAGMSY